MKKKAGVAASSTEAHGWVVPAVADMSASARRERMEILAEFELMPRDHRLSLGLPTTQKELADLLGFTSGALSQWKKTPQFQRIMAARLRNHYGAERLAEVISNLHSIAVGDSPQAVGAARELIKFVEVQERSGDPQGELADLTDDELAALWEAMQRRGMGSESSQPTPAPANGR